MAKLKFVLAPDGAGWHVRSPEGDPVMDINLPASPETMKQLALYGLKQAVSDAGAFEKGTSLASRIKAMQARHDEIHNGTWGFRTGTGAAAVARIPDAIVYRAALAARGVDDTEDRRQRWAALTAAQRAAIAAQPEVAAAMARFATPEGEGAIEF